MKKIITSIILFFVVVASTYTQCNNDATAKKYKSKVDKGLNVQACSQCATLALYLCSASLSTKPEHVKELSSMIAQLKNNIRELAPNNCCPELLGKSPHFGSKVNGTTSKDIFTNTKSSNSDKSSNGIHKDDLVFLIEGKPLKKFGSQGQQKTYLLALKLAQAEYLKEIKNRAPILLLDDIYDKLDEERVTKLMEIIRSDWFGQVFISDTHLDRLPQLFDKLGANYKAFTIKSGEVHNGA